MKTCGFWPNAGDGNSMDSYTLIWVRDARSRPLQYLIPKQRLKQAGLAAAVIVLIGFVAVWDYWRLRADNAELAELRVEAFDQREQIALFTIRLEEVGQQLTRVTDLERKVRIIANLPGTAGVGGDDLAELAPQVEGEVALPVGVPIGLDDSSGFDSASGHRGQGGGGPLPIFDSSSAQDAFFESLDHRAVQLSGSAAARADSLEVLLGQLDDKRQRLVSMPSIWPSKGWLTSRFGARVSPFTGRRQQHTGIDIAAADGTPIHAPARGRVTFAGRKGPLGNALVLDHGFGVKTVYGHAKEILVKTGDTVERGDRIALIGSSGRSTGPHLHYVVEVKGKARNPLDYIFD
jgi:murein DD-endopeptidase MepM/ murein hydrolase activator NlpD